MRDIAEPLRHVRWLSILQFSGPAWHSQTAELGCPRG
jgi:hypothetical protein